MLDLLNEQLGEYKSKYESLLQDCNRLHDLGKSWGHLIEEMTGLFLLIGQTEAMIEEQTKKVI